ncbi:MAG: FAD-binding protein, partial [Oscillospiraceae bacterium]|nr:FAD-binding protein [Oscillospiraceae bacterium]
MYDIVVIGSGPAGLSASVYASRAQLNTVIAEKVYGSAGQITDSEQVDNYL